MFDIKKKERLKWFTYEDDEKYLLKYMCDADKEELKKLEKNQTKFQAKVLEYVVDWEGILDDGKPLKCNAENKHLVLMQQEEWSAFRLTWIFQKIVNYELFFSFEDNLKN